MPGTKTSVWLGESDHARWKASGLSLTEIVRAGLDAIEARSEPAGDDSRAAIREELAASEERIDQRAEQRQERLLRELERMAGR